MSWAITFTGAGVAGGLPNIYAANDPVNRGTLRVINFPTYTDGATTTVTTSTSGNGPSGGTFSLAFTDPFGRAAQQTATANIDWNAPAMGPGSIVEKLSALSLVRTGITATRTTLASSTPGQLVG